MTSYKTMDNYQEETISGVIIKVFEDSFLLKSDSTYYCYPFNRYRSILLDAHRLLDKQVKATGLVEIYCGNIAGIENHVYEFLVHKLELYSEVS